MQLTINYKHIRFHMLGDKKLLYYTTHNMNVQLLRFITIDDVTIQVLTPLRI